MKSLFNKRWFKIFACCCCSFSLCFTFLFSSLNSSKNKASASEIINFTSTVFPLPIISTRSIAGASDATIPSFYLSYRLSDDTNIEDHLFSLIYPIAVPTNDPYTYLLDYNDIQFYSRSRGNLFSVRQIGSLYNMGSDILVAGPYGDSSVYFDLTVYKSMEFILNDTSSYITYQRYNATVNNVKRGYFDICIRGGDNSLYVNLKYYTTTPHAYVDVEPLTYSNVVALTSVSGDYSGLIERAYNHGFQDGLSSGAGYNQGFEAGVTAGYNQGYNQGYLDGLNVSGGGSISGDYGIFGSILRSVDGFLDLNLFGNFSFGDLLSLAFGFILIGLFIKMFLGG